MITINEILVIPTLFPDGTSQVWKLSDEQLSGDSPVIEWRFDNESEVFHVSQLIHLVSSLGKTPALKVPFLPYGRQDKEVSNTSTFALRTLCLVLASVGVDFVITTDAHSNVFKNYMETLGVAVRDVVPVWQINEAKRKFDAKVLCFPDSGASVRYRFIQDGLSIVLDKDRDELTGEIKGLVVSSGCVSEGDRVLIVDDLCDGGRTFIEAAKLLNRITDNLTIGLYVSHGIFSKGTQVLFDAGIDRIFTKDGEVKREPIPAN